MQPSHMRLVRRPPDTVSMSGVSSDVADSKNAPRVAVVTSSPSAFHKAQNLSAWGDPTTEVLRRTYLQRHATESVQA